ncbi:MAG: hypothetical protein HWQ41_15240 [Nostoc sp. NOS(2021)]|uniref:hypothetical protein n=1 Tax=Nostoc sp. NOS(2021) TaxID=2815407 RepID=UPI0025E4741F|nr:hypothetical protein [Nostoc sp. NOS(2021)]MBN3896562.1 hypothetical protein [Nostoc sp. NOS(2021)]
MPNAQCPMPNAQCPIPNTQCPIPNAQTQQSSTKISNNSVAQALHLKEIYVAPSAWRAVFQ